MARRGASLFVKLELSARRAALEAGGAAASAKLVLMLAPRETHHALYPQREATPGQCSASRP